MPTVLTRPTDASGATITPSRTTRPSKPMALVSRGQSGQPQTRNVQATKRQWTEWYPPMERNASVKTFLANLDTYQNEGTELTVTEKFTGDDDDIDCFIIAIEVAEVVPPTIVIGLSITFAES